MYTPQDFQRIIKSFPNIKPCYEKISHNKVSKQCMLIPYGIKCYIWFTQYKNENVCLVLEIFNKKINRVYRVGIHYDSSLCAEMGTILYGTIFMNYKYKLKMISVENILYRNKIVKATHEERINMIYQLFKKKIRSKKVMIGFPIMMNTDDIGPIDDYKVQYCQYQDGETIVKIPFKVFEKKEKNKNRVFRVRPGTQNEIYNLFDKDTDEFVDIAFIPNYTTSLKMNKLFKEKVIKLEEYEDSDDEETGEEKELLLECEYHEKFNKWTPFL